MIELGLFNCNGDAEQVLILADALDEHEHYLAAERLRSKPEMYARKLVLDASGRFVLPGWQSTYAAWLVIDKEVPTVRQSFPGLVVLYEPKVQAWLAELFSAYDYSWRQWHTTQR